MSAKERATRKHIDYRKMASKGLSGGLTEKEEGTAETEDEMDMAYPVGASKTPAKSEAMKTVVTPGKSGLISDGGRKNGTDKNKF